MLASCRCKTYQQPLWYASLIPNNYYSLVDSDIAIIVDMYTIEIMA